MASTEAAENTAPAQFKQPSRKGKKAWRKNVDVTQIQSGLEEVRDQIIQGGVIAEKPSDQLFAVDTTGDAHAPIAKAHKKHSKPLKVDEILAQRSAVPAVSSKKRLSDVSQEKKRKKAKVSGKEYDRLRSIAYGGDQVKKDIIQSGVAQSDPWAVQEVKKDPRFSFLEEKKAKREPVTLKQAPVTLTKSGKTVPAVKKPEGGKSYNPNFNEWQELVAREGDKAVEAEKKRLQEAREEAERLERIMAAASDSEQEGNESAWESEWEGFSDNEEDSLKVKRPERKTPAQRNRINRRKAAESQAKHEARMKAKEQQLQRIKELAKSVEEKEKARDALRNMTLVTNDDSADEEGDEELRKRPLGKHFIPEAPLEVVLPDELKDSLRLLKPEGNLLVDRFRSMMVRGKIEARRQIPFAKKKKVTVTEKWSYKDWKL